MDRDDFMELRAFLEDRLSVEITHTGGVIKVSLYLDALMISESEASYIT